MSSPSSLSSSSLAALGAVLFAGIVAGACGSSDDSVFSDGGPGDGDGSATFDGGSGTLDDGALGGGDAQFSQRDVASITVTPPSASLVVETGQAPPTQAFTVNATYTDGTTGPYTDAITWSADAPQIGSIASSGVYTPTGLAGGKVTVTATAQGKSATATVSVKLHTVIANGVDTGTQGKLRGATAPDAAVKWAYPYDGTVFPRGLNAPELQWLGGADADVVYVHVSSPYYELESFGAAPKQRFTQASTEWTHFVDSTSGAAELKVARLAGGTSGAATVVVDQHWSIAPGSMRGTIYYWAINTGRVMRITPGANHPDDLFSSVSVVPPANGTCVACHSVSANGSTITVGAGHWDTSVDETSVFWSLVSNKAIWSDTADESTSGSPPFALAGISPDGKVAIQNFAPLRGNIANATGIFDVATGAKIAGTGLDDTKCFMPAFAPDNQAIVYVDDAPGNLHAATWDPKTRKVTNDHLVVAKGADTSKQYIEFPTVTPDHQWVLYQRGPALGSLGDKKNVPYNGDLYMAPIGGGAEIKLGSLDGDKYPFAAGDRDRHFDFEPTFAPVASGGYFWVVFHSRRTYGNELTGVAYNGEGKGVKQLWVAAIDQAPKAGSDPSHPAFHLPGQALDTLNMRGYWALEPCKGDGAGCSSGTECCGGYCAPNGKDAGAFVCAAASSGGCAEEGDKCTTAADCCNSTSVECINSVCSAILR